MYVGPDTFTNFSISPVKSFQLARTHSKLSKYGNCMSLFYLSQQPICPPSPSRPGLSPVQDWSDAERICSELSSSQSVGETYGGATVCAAHNRHRCDTCRNNRSRAHHLLNISNKDDEYLDLNDPDPPTEEDPYCIWCQYNSEKSYFDQ
ncbi:hypothetical protein P9112_010456 [Eukaryota sp. TZLM1-RC]